MKSLHRAWMVFLLSSLLIATAGCASQKGSAAEDDSSRQQATTTTQAVKGGSENVELGGYCPVAYKMAGKAIEGSEEFAVERNGKTYLLANAKAKQAFKKMPEKFGVEYDGWCATGLTMGKKIPSDPTIFEVYQGKVYLFSSEKAKSMFDKDRAAAIEKADQTWASK